MCWCTRCISLVTANRAQPFPALHTCIFCAAKPPLRRCTQGKNRQHHGLALPKDRVPWSLCHSGWATELTFEVVAGDVLSPGLSVGFSLRKGIVVEVVSDRALSCLVGRFSHSPCRMLSPCLQWHCLWRAGCLSALSFSLSELESNLYPSRKMEL